MATRTPSVGLIIDDGCGLDLGILLTVFSYTVEDDTIVELLLTVGSKTSNRVGVVVVTCIVVVKTTVSFTTGQRAYLLPASIMY